MCTYIYTHTFFFSQRMLFAFLSYMTSRVSVWMIEKKRKEKNEKDKESMWKNNKGWSSYG